MVIVLALMAVNHGFMLKTDQMKACEIGICYFSAKHVALRRKSKDWLVQNKDNVSGWGDMSIDCCFSELAL